MLVALLAAIAPAAAGDGWTVAVPFGVGLYVHGKPVRGVVYSATQAGGLAALVVGSTLGRQASSDGDTEQAELMQVVSAGGAAVAAASWLVSGIDGSRVHELEGREKAEALRAWERQLAARHR
jgi:hypothetical protein